VSKARPGVSGLELVSDTSADNSDSEKTADAFCPAGKRVIGTGAEINGSLTGAVAGSRLTDVVIREIIPSPPNIVPGVVSVIAIEEEATAAPWSITAYALCANVS
jgi:hypothetical protein